MFLPTDPVFLAFSSSGPDPFRDEFTYLEAVRFGETGSESLIEPTRFIVPGDEGPTAKLRSGESQVTATAPHRELPVDALPEQLAGLADLALVLGSRRQEFLDRYRRWLPDAALPDTLDLEGFAELLLPSRGERELAALWSRYRAQPMPAPPSALDLRDLLESLIRKHFDRHEALRQLLARVLDELRLQALDENESQVADWLEFAQRLLDRPSRFLLQADPELADGALGRDLDAAPLMPERCLREIDPQFTQVYRNEFESSSPLPTRQEGNSSLLEEDWARLERFFDELPEQFAAGDLPPQERPGQRALAHAVAESLESQGFLLADAPTGTGKTLAYLAPILIWSARHNVSVGLSTYTRALQEQAFFRELPRALKLLKHCGLEDERMPRVSLLKGRANYACGRAMIDAAPEANANSLAYRATWLRLCLYYSEDPSCDLDGFSLHSGLPLENAVRSHRQAAQMVDQVRSLPQCCVGKAALRCAAGVRGLRRERSHLVVTNHAYVLSRPESFGHLVFDECDHLHEVTVSARSYEIDLGTVSDLGQELLRMRGGERAPLERLSRLLRRLPPGDAGPRLKEAAADAGQGSLGLDAAAHQLTRELRRFRTWQEETGSQLSDEERAFLLYDFLESGRGESLHTALSELKRKIDLIDGALRTLLEELGALPQRPAKSLRWSLRRPLERLAHWREGLDLWLGSESGDASHSEDLHYEVSFPKVNRPVLALRWLLPQKWLGEFYYPSLRSAACVSATAHLKGGFKAMKGYLGLDLLEQETEERTAREVGEFRGPSTFDPQAALICCPEDAPPFVYRGEGQTVWSEYVEDFLLYLAERTRGRILGLFTNRVVLQRTAERLSSAFAARGLRLFWQGMPGMSKEEILASFRNQVESVLLGLDTFWYGVDFPGETCQYVVMTKLPYGPLDDYLHAQRARMGFGPHRNRVYLPRALAMFRQGCGRLLRKEDDRGVVFLLDRRVLERRHADFLRELPGGQEEFEQPNLLVTDTDDCFWAAFQHMGLRDELLELGLHAQFSESRSDSLPNEA